MKCNGFNFEAYPPIERNADGSLVRLSLKQWWEVKHLIRDHCCHLDPDGNCLLLDDGKAVACPQFHSRSVCCTFLRFVLMKVAAARALEMSVFRRDELRRCFRCGQPFIPGGNRAKYCADCKAIVQREQKAEYAKRRRAKSRKIEISIPLVSRLSGRGSRCPRITIPGNQNLPVGGSHQNP